jgi:ubiquinone/menaquinone biosynthesis C-methylase UbiE
MAADCIAQRRAQMPSETTAILDRRSLTRDHRRLLILLRPGHAVLDVGCGSGAITRGIVDAVGPAGCALGIDANPVLIDAARRVHGAVAGLAFEVHDVYTLPYRERFDVVTAARVLQWLAEPARALAAMMRAARPGGRVVALDYNHERLRLEPEPGAAARKFLAMFLRWRADAGMDNAIADHLEELLRRAGVVDVVVTPQHETVGRADADFIDRAGIWADVAATRGRHMVGDGFIDEDLRANAEAELRAWAHDAGESMTMYLLAADGERTA